MQYIGESERSLQERFSEHRTYVTSRQLSKANRFHFNLAGHSISDMKVTILDPLVRKEREDFFIRRFNTKYKRMNKM